MFRIPKGGRVALENASYAGRDWSVALTALEVKEDSRPVAGVVTTVWTFQYTNTDREPHYIALKVRCLDARRNEQTRFMVKATLLGDRPNGDRVEIRAGVRESDWQLSAWANLVVDFLSTPEG